MYIFKKEIRADKFDYACWNFAFSIKIKFITCWMFYFKDALRIYLVLILAGIIIHADKKRLRKESRSQPKL